MLHNRTPALTNIISYSEAIHILSSKFMISLSLTVYVPVADIQNQGIHPCFLIWKRVNKILLMKRLCKAWADLNTGNGIFYAHSLRKQLPSIKITQNYSNDSKTSHLHISGLQIYWQNSKPQLKVTNIKG